MGHGVMLRMVGVRKSYAGVQALADGSIEVRAGETVALVGENGAGKSTLMKVLLGLVRADAGTVEFDGRPAAHRSPADALAAGISMIHQEISLVPGLSIAENIWLGRESGFARAGFVGRAGRELASQQLLDQLRFPLQAGQLVGSLSIAQMQLVEIARAVSSGSKLIVMDEPTSALTPSEVELLFATIDELVSRGVAVIFISHKLDEVFRLADRICVMRDGRTITTENAEDLTTDDLVRLIAGRELADATDRRSRRRTGEVVLRVEGLTGDGFSDVSFDVAEGEVFGFCGLMGAGRTEIVSTLFGLNRRTAGTVWLNGKETDPRSPREAVAAGFGMVTEDRLRSGSIYTYSVMKNSTMPVIRQMRSRGFIDAGREAEAYARVKELLRIRSTSRNTLIGELSGGNQQKVLVSRWLHRAPKVLILDEPTRGIDVGAKAEIYDVIDEVASRQVAVVVVSSELPELLAICDRIAVIHQGRLVHIEPGATATQESLLAHAFGVATRSEEV